MHYFTSLFSQRIASPPSPLGASLHLLSSSPVLRSRPRMHPGHCFYLPRLSVHGLTSRLFAHPLSHLLVRCCTSLTLQLNTFRPHLSVVASSPSALSVLLHFFTTQHLPHLSAHYFIALTCQRVALPPTSSPPTSFQLIASLPAHGFISLAS